MFTSEIVINKLVSTNSAIQTDLFLVGHKTQNGVFRLTIQQGKSVSN